MEQGQVTTINIGATNSSKVTSSSTSFDFEAMHAIQARARARSAWRSSTAEAFSARPQSEPSSPCASFRPWRERVNALIRRRAALAAMVQVFLSLIPETVNDRRGMVNYQRE